jgi:hypothetical protein
LREANGDLPHPHEVTNAAVEMQQERYEPNDFIPETSNGADPVVVGHNDATGGTTVEPSVVVTGRDA